MNTLRVLVFTCLLVVWAAAETDNADDDSGIEMDDGEGGGNAELDFSSEVYGEEFIATNEWQKIQPGQAIPKGLHVRINFETGLKEAKLLDESEESDPAHTHTHTVDGPGQSAMTVREDTDDEDEGYASISDEEAEAEETGSSESAAKPGHHYFTPDQSEYQRDGPQISRQELKEALKNFRATTLDLESKEKVKKFRDINELKAEFEEMDMNIETDSEVLTKLMTDYRQTNLAADMKITILTDIEYLVHQIDNARDFVGMGGFELILRDLNDTDEYVQSEAAFVLGSATQSNPKVQVMAVELGLLNQILRMLPTETSQHLLNRILYALSSILRNFPYAQQKFIEFGGLHTLSTLFSKPGPTKVKVKAVTLITDLLLEKMHAEQFLDPGKLHESERLHQYNLVPLLDHITEQRWCTFLPDLLSISGHDHREKVLTAMSTLLQPCKSDFLQSEVLALLSSLREEYRTLAHEELVDGDTDQYFDGLLRTVIGLLRQLDSKVEL